MSKKWLVILLTVIGILSVLALMSPALASSKPGPALEEKTPQYDASSSADNNAPVLQNTIMSGSRSSTDSVPLNTALTTYKMYLYMDGISGESIAENNRDWIDILSFNWGLSMTVGGTGASGRAASRARLNEFSFSHLLDKASPRLMSACAQARLIKNSIFEVYDDVHSLRRIYQLKMNEALVTSINMNGTPSVQETVQASRPLEDVVLNFLKAEWNYYPAIGSPINGIYDSRQGK